MAERPLMEDLVKRAFDANLRYWDAVGRATTDYVQAVSKIWSDAPITWTPGVNSRTTNNAGAASASNTASVSSPAASASSNNGPSLLLEGLAGTQARAVVMISNDLDRDAEAVVTVSSLRGPDGRFVALEIRATPESVKLAAGARVPVTLVADITDTLAAGADYHGEINVPGLSARGVPVVLRRRIA
jgi:hypothetical protein